MKIALIDVDGHHYPNLALMKLAAYHKKMNDTVEFINYFEHYDIVYKSKVFSYTPDEKTIIQADKIISGGTGYNYTDVLPPDIEHITPDYNLYPVTRWYDGQTAYGFTTRGCANRCSWCVVPAKEGHIKPHSNIDEFIADKKKAIIMDNNILAHGHGLEQIEQLAKRKIATDFNQGLDARLIANTPEIARLLTHVKYIRFLRIACDTATQMGSVFKTFELLQKYGFPAHRIFVYCLVKNDLIDAEKRVKYIHALGGNPFAMPFRDYKPTYNISPEQKLFARWVNQKRMFKTSSWNDFKKRYKI